MVGFGFVPRSADPAGKVAACSMDDLTRCDHCSQSQMHSYQCSDCKSTLCLTCLPLQSHSCAAAEAKPEAAVHVYTPCSKAGCGQRTPVPMSCTFCRKSFCSQHRTEGDHDCPEWRVHAAAQLRQAEAEKAARRAMLRRPQQSKADQNVIQPVGLHRDDAVPFTVLTPPMLGLPNPHSVRVNKNHAVGRTSEWIAKELGIGSQRFSLLRGSDLQPLPPMLVPFKELVRRGTLSAGDRLFLVPHSWLSDPGSVRRRCAEAAAAKEDSLWTRALAYVPEVAA
eukprot:TRINITY_DN1169_c0_g1_i1.p1 TRINITY_DN1169_c0_g1~~TRINITY_DN1169_c0_g1_i1.p1  ORF type:complete len:306 (+),score=90.68 TRINITY_DN1169_c0_g1_i1:80-919(+)